MVDILLSIVCFSLSIVCLRLSCEVRDLRQKYEYIDRQVWIIEEGVSEEA